MRLASIIDVSLVDVPGIPVTVLFTGGCNFDCPYCQNASLIPIDSGDNMTIPDIISKVGGFLSDGFCVTGGEPTLHRDLPDLLHALKQEIGGHINLNTQGSNPSVLRTSLPYLDSIWFDLKAAPDRYNEVCRVKENPWPRIRESVNLILRSNVAFWPRTTYASNLLGIGDIHGILSFLESVDFNGDYVIQNYVPSLGVREEEAKELGASDESELESVILDAPSGINIRLEWR